MSSRTPTARHRRPRRSHASMARAGVAFGTAAAAVLAAGAAASADTGNSGDARADSFDGNVTSCGDGDKGAGIGGKEYGDDQGGNPSTVVEYTGKAGETYLSITEIKDGFDVLAVAVKGGKSGYNLYKPGDLGALPWKNLHAPLNKDKPAAISHFLICATEAAPSAGSDDSEAEEPKAGADKAAEDAEDAKGGKDKDEAPAAGDDRATAYPGNATDCTEGQNPIGVEGERYGIDEDGEYADPNDVLTYGEGELGGTNLDITAVKDGYEIVAVVVKGGNGYNLYKPAELGDLPWNDLHSPVNASGRPAGISHWFVCVQQEATTEGGTDPGTPGDNGGGTTPEDDGGGTTPGDDGGSTPGEEGGGSTPGVGTEGSDEDGGSTPGEESGGTTPEDDGGGSDPEENGTPGEEQGTPETTGEQDDDGDQDGVEAAPPAAGSSDDDSDNAEDGDEEAVATETKSVKGKKLPKTGGGAEAGLAAVGSLLVGAGAMLVGSGGGGGRHRASRRRGAHRRG